MTDYRSHEERVADAKSDFRRARALIMNTTSTTEERVRALLDMALDMVKAKEELRNVERERGEEPSATTSTAASVYKLLAIACYIATEADTQEHCWQCGCLPSRCSCQHPIEGVSGPT